GFVARLGELASSNRRGKAVLTVPKQAAALGLFPVTAADAEGCVATSGGQLLCLAREALPWLAKGQGNKLVALKKGESVVAGATLSAAATLVLYSGKRYMVLKAADRDDYRGPRASRGKRLPRGFTNVHKLEAG